MQQAIDETSTRGEGFRNLTTGKTNHAEDHHQGYYSDISADEAYVSKKSDADKVSESIDCIHIHGKSERNALMPWKKR